MQHGAWPGFTFPVGFRAAARG